MKKQTAKQLALVEDAKQKLLEILHENDTVYTILRSVSPSGMARRIDVVALVNNEPRFLTYWVAQLLQIKHAKDNGVLVKGAGMDMGWDLVDRIAERLFGAGLDKLKQRWM